jgi:hypothetical protein
VLPNVKSTYRVFHDFMTYLPEVIFPVFVIKKGYINMCPSWIGYGGKGIFQFAYMPWGEPRRSQLAGDLGGLSLCQLSHQPNYSL